MNKIKIQLKIKLNFKFNIYKYYKNFYILVDFLKIKI